MQKYSKNTKLTSYKKNTIQKIQKLHHTKNAKNTIQKIQKYTKIHNTINTK